MTYLDADAPRRAEEEEDGSGSIRKSDRDKTYERPGLSPAIVPLLLNRFLFLRLSDIAHAFPPYEEVVHPLTLPQDIAERYGILERAAIEWAREHGGGGIARFLQALLGYPDQPWDGETLTATMLDQSGTKQRCVVAAVPGLDPTQRTPKEEALLALLTRERARGRKVLVFVIHTETRDIMPRLVHLAEQAGVRLAPLRAGGETRTRKQQVRRLLAQGADGILSGITQELKSAIKCWCYGQPQPCNNPCNGNVSYRLTVAQHTDELGEVSASLRPRVARYLASRPLSEGTLVPTAMGIFRARARADGGLSGDG